MVPDCVAGASNSMDGKLMATCDTHAVRTVDFASGYQVASFASLRPERVHSITNCTSLPIAVTC